MQSPWRGVCPARYFCIKYPVFKPGFTLPQRSPPSRLKSGPNELHQSVRVLLHFKQFCIRRQVCHPPYGPWDHVPPHVWNDKSNSAATKDEGEDGADVCALCCQKRSTITVCGECQEHYCDECIDVTQHGYITPAASGIPTHLVSPTGKGPCKERGLRLRIESGQKRCPARARCAAAPPLWPTSSPKPLRLDAWQSPRCMIPLHILWSTNVDLMCSI